MIHDSYKNFLRDSWFTKTFDDLFNKWISQRLLCRVLRSFFGVQTSVFIQNYINFLTTVSLSHHSFCPDIEFFGHWALSTSVTRETSRLSASNVRIIWGGGSGGMLPRKKNWNLDLRKRRHILQSLDRTQLIHAFFVALFSETRYPWFPSRSTKIHDSPVLKTKIHDSYKFCDYHSWFMIPLPPPKLKPLERKYLNRGKILILIIFNLKMKCWYGNWNYLSCQRLPCSKLSKYRCWERR